MKIISQLLDGPVEICKFIERHKLSKLTQEEIENVNRPIRN